jgi:hypothetical protein
MVEIVILLVLANIAATVGLIAYLYKEKLDLDEIHERFDELSGSISVVAEVLTRLPDLLPQFSINQSPFGPLIEAFANRMGQQWGSNPDTLLRDDTGRYSDGEAESEEEIPT